MLLEEVCAGSDSKLYVINTIGYFQEFLRSITFLVLQNNWKVIFGHGFEGFANFPWKSLTEMRWKEGKNLIAKCISAKVFAECFYWSYISHKFWLMIFAIIFWAISLFNSFPMSGDKSLLITFANSLDPDQTQTNVRSDLDSNCLTLWWYSWKI